MPATLSAGHHTPYVEAVARCHPGGHDEELTRRGADVPTTAFAPVPRRRDASPRGDLRHRDSSHNPHRLRWRTCGPLAVDLLSLAVLGQLPREIGGMLEAQITHLGPFTPAATRCAGWFLKPPPSVAHSFCAPQRRPSST